MGCHPSQLTFIFFKMVKTTNQVQLHRLFFWGSTTMSHHFQRLGSSDHRAKTNGSETASSHGKWWCPRPDSSSVQNHKIPPFLVVLWLLIAGCSIECVGNCHHPRTGTKWDKNLFTIITESHIIHHSTSFPKPPGFGDSRDSQLRIPQALDKQRRELTNQVKTLKQEVPMTRRTGPRGPGQGEADWVHPFFRGQWATRFPIFRFFLGVAI